MMHRSLELRGKGYGRVWLAGSVSL